MEQALSSGCAFQGLLGKPMAPMLIIDRPVPSSGKVLARSSIVLARVHRWAENGVFAIEKRKGMTACHLQTKAVKNIRV
jgi:hypothetical protein